MPKPSLSKRSSGTIYSVVGDFKSIHFFLNDINPNDNVIARLAYGFRCLSSPR